MTTTTTTTNPAAPEAAPNEEITMATKTAKTRKTTTKKARAPRAAKPSKAAPAKAKVRPAKAPKAPPAGVLVRHYKGRDHTITPNPDGGFTYAGKSYASLTAVALEITGYKAISGPAFFARAKAAGTGA